jgi:hypothetical protein
MATQMTDNEIERLRAAVEEQDACRREAMADNARMWWLLREAYYERERPMSVGLAYRIGQCLNLSRVAADGDTEKQP